MHSLLRTKHISKHIITCKFGNDIIEVINNCINDVFAKRNNQVSMIVDVNPNNML